MDVRKFSRRGRLAASGLVVACSLGASPAAGQVMSAPPAMGGGAVVGTQVTAPAMSAPVTTGTTSVPGTTTVPGATAYQGDPLLGDGAIVDGYGYDGSLGDGRFVVSGADASIYPAIQTCLTPYMLGDFVGGFSFGTPVVAANRPLAETRAQGRFKVADNNSPIPRRRLFYSLNYFEDPFGVDGDLYRNFTGAEYALLDNRVSIQYKAAIDHYANFAGFEDEADRSDTRITLKAVALQTDAILVSGGLGVGLPTANVPLPLADDNYIFAPFVGWIYRPAGSPFYIQGFEQYDIPSEGNDAQILHTDVGVGVVLWDRPDATLSMLAPTIEIHAYSIIDDATGAYQALDYQDVVNMTLGVTAGICANATAALGYSFPLTDDDHYDHEIQLHLNLLFGSVR